MSDKKQCDDCGKDVPKSVITCDNCTWKRVAPLGMSKDEWVASLVSKPEKPKEKPKPRVRKENNKTADK